MFPLTALLLGCEAEPMSIAARNTSEFDYEDLVFGEVTWGDLAAGETTDFTDVDVAYDYTNVSFTISAVAFGLVPTDYVGEDPLPPGRHVYELAVEDAESGLVAVAVVDEL